MYCIEVRYKEIDGIDELKQRVLKMATQYGSLGLQKVPECLRTPEISPNRNHLGSDMYHIFTDGMNALRFQKSLWVQKNLFGVEGIAAATLLNIPVRYDPQLPRG